MRLVSKANATLHSIRRAEPQFLHIRVSRSVQRVHARPSQLRPKLLKDPGQRQQLGPHFLAQFVELRLKLIANLDDPAHPHNMTYDPYMLSSTCLPACCRSTEVSETKIIPPAPAVGTSPTAAHRLSQPRSGPLGLPDLFNSACLGCTDCRSAAPGGFVAGGLSSCCAISPPYRTATRLPATANGPFCVLVTVWT